MAHAYTVAITNIMFHVTKYIDRIDRYWRKTIILV